MLVQFTQIFKQNKQTLNQIPLVQKICSVQNAILITDRKTIVGMRFQLLEK